MTQPSVPAINPRLLSSKKNLCKPDWLVAILISAVIVWLHFIFWLHVGGFWRDEVNSLNIASRHSLREMSQDSFPVLMPLLLHGWLALGLGENDLELRVFGLLTGLGILVALWIAAKKIHGSPPVLVLALLGLNPTLIVFGDSLRAYGLGSLLMILNVTSAGIFLKKPSWSRAGWLAFFSVLGVQLLYHNAILVGAICISAGTVCMRRKNWRAAGQVLAAGTAAAISLLPYVPNLIFGRNDSVVLRTGATPARFFEKLAESTGFPFAPYVYVWAFFAVAAIAYAGIILSQKAKPQPTSAEPMQTEDLCLFAGITLLLAVIMFVFFLWSAALSIQSWYLLPLMALAAVCFEIFLTAGGKKLRLALLIFALINTLIAMPVARSQINYRFTNMDIRVRQLVTHLSPDDYIIVLPWFCGISFENYFKGSTHWTTVPPIADHSVHRYDLIKTQLQDTNAIQPVFQQIADTLRSGNRVFILASWGWIDIPNPRALPPPSLPPAPLKSSGWSEMPYTEVWASQIKHFLADHSCRFVLVKNPTEGTLLAEQMELFMIDGWKTNSLP